MRESIQLLFSGSRPCLKPASSSLLESMGTQLSAGIYFGVRTTGACVTVHHSQQSQNGRLV
jgi:hypothetical protein